MHNYYFIKLTMGPIDVTPLLYMYINILTVVILKSLVYTYNCLVTQLLVHTIEMKPTGPQSP